MLTGVLIVGFVYWLLEALNEAQEMAEKAIVEVTIRNVRVGMQLAIGEAMLHGRESQISGWVGANPLRWLGAAPDGYVGKCDPGNAGRPSPGHWCFDSERRELVYSPRSASHLRLLSGSKPKILRWRVVATGGPHDNGQIGLRVENVTPYEWFLN